MVMGLVIEYDSEPKSLPPDNVNYENEYQPEPWSQATLREILFEAGYGWQFISIPKKKLPGFGMWKDRTETDEDLLTELRGNWGEFPIEP